MPSGAKPFWTDEKLEAALRDVAGSTGVFPSSTMLREMGRNDLAVQVTRRGGFIAWARRMGCARKQSDSDFGWHGEIEFVRLCAGQGLPAERCAAVKSPWDVVVCDVLRVDVKTAKCATYGHKSGWHYRIGKAPQADLVVLYQADTGDFYAVPWHKCPTSSVTLARGGGKYAAFLNNWKLIRQMIGMRVAEKAMQDRAPVPDVA